MKFKVGDSVRLEYVAAENLLEEYGESIDELIQSEKRVYGFPGEEEAIQYIIEKVGTGTVLSDKGFRNFGLYDVKFDLFTNEFTDGELDLVR